METGKLLSLRGSMDEPSYAWQPGKNTAECHCVGQSHSCGFYAMKDPSALEIETGQVVGGVVLFGQVEEAEKGYRAEHAKIDTVFKSSPVDEDLLRLVANHYELEIVDTELPLKNVRIGHWEPPKPGPVATPGQFSQMPAPRTHWPRALGGFVEYGFVGVLIFVLMAAPALSAVYVLSFGMGEVVQAVLFPTMPLDRVSLLLLGFVTSLVVLPLLVSFGYFFSRLLRLQRP